MAFKQETGADLGHDLLVDFELGFSPIDFCDFHSEQKHFSGNEFAASQSCGAVSFVLDVEVAAVSEFKQTDKKLKLKMSIKQCRYKKAMQTTDLLVKRSLLNLKTNFIIKITIVMFLEPKIKTRNIN